MADAAASGDRARRRGPPGPGTAVFVDGWTIEAATQVAGIDEDEALELTEALAGHSLVYLGVTDRGRRSRMLDTIRAFVAEALASRPDVADIRGRHAEHYRVLAEQADRPLRSAGQHEWTERLQTEAGNLAAAVRWNLDNDPAPLPHLFRDRESRESAVGRSWSTQGRASARWPPSVQKIASVERRCSISSSSGARP